MGTSDSAMSVKCNSNGNESTATSSTIVFSTQNNVQLYVQSMNICVQRFNWKPAIVVDQRGTFGRLP